MDSKKSGEVIYENSATAEKINNEKGMVLVIAVMLLAVLVVVGFTAATMTSTDSK